ncbi:MAG: hypothetical protein M3Q22_08485 [Actinomycetota bacterium]|nr:hypothetical protein [Actinomycetota bacterium]
MTAIYCCPDCHEPTTRRRRDARCDDCRSQVGRRFRDQYTPPDALVLNRLRDTA